MENLRDFADLDLTRAQRTGYGEMVMAAGKTPKQVAAIMSELSQHQDLVVATKATAADFAAVSEVLPKAVFFEMAGIVAVRGAENIERKTAGVAVLTAGTADMAVAEEAAVLLELYGRPVQRIYDVGVAGLHRILARLEEVRRADVVIVCAGMDGALPSVVAGLVAAPVLAVPTSRGYGAAFGGATPLLSMLNSCALGTAAFNIDNGIGAAHFADMICRLRLKEGGSADCALE